jgi:hypothetical protein
MKFLEKIEKKQTRATFESSLVFSFRGTAHFENSNSSVRKLRPFSRVNFHAKRSQEATRSKTIHFSKCTLAEHFKRYKEDKRNCKVVCACGRSGSFVRTVSNLQLVFSHRTCS